jgi:hypothetical protein
LFCAHSLLLIRQKGGKQDAEVPMFEINMSTPKTSRAGAAAQALHRDDLTLLDTT